MRFVPIEHIKENSILGDTIYSVDGVLLANEGIKLTARLLNKIKENQIFTLYITDEHSNSKINRLIHPNLRNKAMLIIKEIFLAAGYRDANGQLKSKSIYEYMSSLNSIVDEILLELSSKKNIPLEYIDIKSVENYLYMSSLNCGILGALIAMDMDYNYEMTKNIFLAGIFHDIGMALIPPDIFQKKTEFTTEEKMMIINHPKIGIEFLKDKHFLNAYVKQATLQHHEKLDGTGYPLRISGEEINTVSQIVGITDVYDAMTSDKPYRRATTPHEAIEYLMAGSGRLFDSNVVSVFTKKINPYPPGSLVKLSTGDIAVVDEVIKGLPLRPKLRLIKGTEGNYSYEPLDLTINHKIFIESLVYNID